MTLTVGKNQFHIGFWETGLLIVALCGAVWTCKSYLDKFTQKQDIMYNAVVDKMKKDSIRDIRIENNTKHIYAVEGKTDTNSSDISDIKKAIGFRRVQKFITETRDEAGRIKTHPYKN